jgi:cystathionine gamma-synthase
MGKRSPSIETTLTQAGCRGDERTGALSMPIHQSATFAHAALGQSTGFDYSRTANPTRSMLERTLARAEGGDAAFAFASGLAAIDAVVHLLQAGERLVATEDVYGGTYRLFERVVRRRGIEPVFVDTSDTGAVRRALDEPGVRLLFVESPTNPLLKVADLRALSALARERGIWMAADNTFLTPCYQRPLEQGADLVVYSASKYLAGHNEVVAGAVVTGTPELSERIGFVQNAVGAIAGPMDAWLILRGLKTLPLRMERQQANAQAIATWLAAHPRVGRVFYPGLPGHPGSAILKREGAGTGAMCSFAVKDPERVPAILENLQTILFAESLGGVESLITYPLLQTHADMDPALLQRLGIDTRLLRLSVGTEHIDDLIADLEQVL